MEDHKKETGHKQFQALSFDLAFDKYTVNQLQLSLQQAIISSLSALGERTMNSIVWYLKSKGVVIYAKNIDIRLFYTGLEEVIGPAVDTVFETIIDQLCIQHKINPEKQYEHLGSDLHPLEKLQQLLKVIRNDGWMT